MARRNLSCLFILLAAWACARVHRERVAVAPSPRDQVVTPGGAPGAPASLPGVIGRSLCSSDAECPGDMICLPRDGTCIRSYPERSFLVASLDGATQLKECRLNHVFFEFDSAELTPATKEWLDHNLRCIAVLGLDRVIIQGHADARGDAAYNQELSRRRAEAVRDYLRQKGLTAQVPIRPMGEWTPLPSGRTEREFAWERRVEFHVK